MNYTEISKIESAYLITKDLIRQTAALVLSRTRLRTPAIVQKEYHTDKYSMLLNNKRWLKSTSLSNYLVEPKQNVLVAKIDNKLVRVSEFQYYSFRKKILQDIIREYNPQNFDVCELGCGTGHHAVSLADQNIPYKIYGFDISDYAIKAAQEIVEHFKVKNVKFEVSDLLDAQAAVYKTITNKIAYSYYCFEQLENYTEEIIEHIIAAKPKMMIHIEPTSELYDKMSAKDWLNYIYLVRKDYQRHLLSALRKFEKKGKIQILNSKRLYYAPTIKHDGTLIVWKPV